MELFLGKDADDKTIDWSEDRIQMYIAQKSKQGGYLFAASLEGVHKSKQSAGKAKAMGMVAGEPDLRYYIPGGKLIFIELKNAVGKLTKSQEERIPLLQENGFQVNVVKAETPADGWRQVKEILDASNRGK